MYIVIIDLIHNIYVIIYWLLNIGIDAHVHGIPCADIVPGKTTKNIKVLIK